MVMSIMIMSAVVVAPIGFILSLISSRVTLENANSFKLIGLEHALDDHETILLNETMDLSILSSFNCSAPTPLTFDDYISAAFVENHDKVLDAMVTHPRYKDDLETLPRIEQTQTFCSVNEPCTTTIQYQKPYGIDFDISNKLNKTAMFYCCDPKVKYDLFTGNTTEQANVCNITETLLVNPKYNNNSILWVKSQII